MIKRKGGGRADEPLQVCRNSRRKQKESNLEQVEHRRPLAEDDTLNGWVSLSGGHQVPHQGIHFSTVFETRCLVDEVLLGFGLLFYFFENKQRRCQQKKEEKEKENQARNYRSFFVKELLLRHRRTAVGAFRVFLITNKQKQFGVKETFQKEKKGRLRDPPRWNVQCTAGKIDGHTMKNKKTS